MKVFESLLSIVGLVLTGIGAFVAARSVILSEKQAEDIASTKWDLNTDLKNSLLSQSKNAGVGLGLVVVGTVMQIAAVVTSLCD